MEDKFSKGSNYKTKGEHGNSGPENFVHPTFKISGSAPGHNIMFYRDIVSRKKAAYLFKNSMDSGSAITYHTNSPVYNWIWRFSPLDLILQ